MTDLFGLRDYVLRIIPLVAYLASIHLVYKLALKITDDQTMSLFAAAMLSLTYFMVYYATEVKQYMLDVFFILLLYDVVFSCNNKTKVTYVPLAIQGVIAMFSTTISIVPLASIGLFLLVDVWKNKNWKVLYVLVTWVVCLIFNYLVFVHHHPSKEIMLDHWQAKFLPINPFRTDFYEFLAYAAGTLFRFVMSYGAYWILGLAISIYGLFILTQKQKYWMVYFLLVPILFHLALSALKLYPFYGRFILYLAPLIVILISIGWLSLYRQMMSKVFHHTRPHQMVWATIPLFLFGFSLLKKIPIQKEEIKYIFNYIDSNRKPGEDLYVYYGAKRAFKFYHQSGYYKNLDLATFGRNGRMDLSAFDKDIDEMGSVIWFLFSHVDNDLTKPDDEADYLLKRIDSRGGRVTKRIKAFGSRAYLVVLE
jgi:hypothetical protein